MKDNKKNEFEEFDPKKDEATSVDSALNEIFLDGSSAESLSLIEGESEDIAEVSTSQDFNEIELDGEDDSVELEVLDTEKEDTQSVNIPPTEDSFGEIELAAEEVPVQDETPIEDNEEDLSLLDDDNDLPESSLEELEDDLGQLDESELDLDSSLILDDGASLLAELNDSSEEVLDENDSLENNEDDLLSLSDEEGDDLLMDSDSLDGEDFLVSDEPEIDTEEEKHSLSLVDSEEGLDYEDLPDADVEFETSPEIEGESEFLDATSPSFEFTSLHKLEEIESEKEKRLELSDDAKKKLEEIDEMMRSEVTQNNIAVEADDSSLNLTEEIEPVRVESVPEIKTASPELSVVSETKITQESNFGEGLTQDYQDLKVYYQQELQKMSQTIKMLREDRDQLERSLMSFEDRKSYEKREVINLKAELEDKNIEFEVLENKYSKLFEDLKTQVEILSDKKSYLEVKNRQLEKEVEDSQRQQRVDNNQVRKREKELEEMLSLLKQDTEVQLRNRDHKILNLQRKIDTLEFDIENASLKERKVISTNRDLEEKMNNLISTLREALGDAKSNQYHERSSRIKKSLDV